MLHHNFLESKLNNNFTCYIIKNSLGLNGWFSLSLTGVQTSRGESGSVKVSEDVVNLCHLVFYRTLR